MKQVSIMLIIISLVIIITGCMDVINSKNSKNPQWQILISSDGEWKGVITGKNDTKYNIERIKGVGNKTIYCPKSKFTTITITAETDICNSVGITLLDNNIKISQDFGFNKAKLNTTGPIKIRDDNKRVLVIFNSTRAPSVNCTTTDYSHTSVYELSPINHVKSTFSPENSPEGITFIYQNYTCINASKLIFDFDVTRSGEQFIFETYEVLHFGVRGSTISKSKPINGFIIRCNLKLMDEENKPLVEKSITSMTKPMNYKTIDTEGKESRIKLKHPICADQLTNMEIRAFDSAASSMEGELARFRDTELIKYTNIR